MSARAYVGALLCLLVSPVLMLGVIVGFIIGCVGAIVASFGRTLIDVAAWPLQRVQKMLQ